MKRMACAVALAAGSGLTGLAALPALAGPSPATAASGLQVAVVPPGTVSGQATIPLDVKFHGGNIRVIELFVDGTQLTRQAITTRDGRGTVHFSLDPTLFTEGSHEVLIKAYEADGTCATTTTMVQVATADLNVPARIEWPKSKAEVQGIVPIKIKIDPSIMDPYVTYTVDNDFLAFRNYAPYVYNWDSTKLDNGLHSIGIEVMDGRTLQVVQKIKLAVNVKNVMGFTKIPPANGTTAKVENGNVAETIKGVAENSAPTMGLSARDAALNLARGSANASQPFVRKNSTVSGFRSNSAIKNGGSPGHIGSPLSNLPLVNMPLDDTKFVATNLPLKHTSDRMRPLLMPLGLRTVDRPASNPGGSHIPPGLQALAVNPRELMPLDAGITLKIARQSVHFHRSGGIALRPGTVRHASRGGAAAPAPAAYRPISRKSFDIAFNNNLINFDVAPRIENGLPLAPFRAIFESNGGKVKWFNEAKIVRATDNNHEIEIKIGSKDAKVNNQSISMEAVPYLDHGRTIVPLSFVRDSMDVKVTFDKETGHLLIEKK